MAGREREFAPLRRPSTHTERYANRPTGGRGVVHDVEPNWMWPAIPPRPSDTDSMCWTVKRMNRAMKTENRTEHGGTSTNKAHVFRRRL